MPLISGFLQPIGKIIWPQRGEDWCFFTIFYLQIYIWLPFHLFKGTRPGKLSHNYGKSPCFIGKSTMNGHFQQLYVSLPEDAQQTGQSPRCLNRGSQVKAERLKDDARHTKATGFLPAAEKTWEKNGKETRSQKCIGFEPHKNHNKDMSNECRFHVHT